MGEDLNAKEAAARAILRRWALVALAVAVVAGLVVAATVVLSRGRPRLVHPETTAPDR